MNNKMNTNEQLSRMKSLMNYGLKTESKTPYSSIENQKVGADGKVYGIVREGAKYYIKSAPNKKNLVKEDFSYIGGFRNRKDHEYSNFALAQKQFDLKMMSLKEAANDTTFNVSSWNLDKKETVVVEATDKMKKEILREKQIMKNATVIAEKKGAICCDAPESPKNNLKGCGKPETGDAPKAMDDYEDGKKHLPKEMTEEVLGWNRNQDYLDKSHGTEIGDSAPFDDATARNIDSGDKKVSKTGEMKNGTVEEGTSMHDSDNQNTPTPGVGKVGDNQPFDGEKGKQIDEAVDDFGGEEPMDDEEPMGDDLEGGDDFGGDEPMGDDLEGGDEFGADDFDGEEDFGEEDDDFGAEEDDDDIYEDDLESRVSAMEDVLNQIAAKLGVGPSPVDDSEYEDDDLFGDEEGDDFEDDEFGDDLGGDDFEDDGLEGGDEFDDEEDDDLDMMESRNRRGGVRIYESAAYRKAMRKQRMNEEGMTPFKDAGRVPSGNMNKLSDFGKHPAYQKKVMSLPKTDMEKFPGYYDINDESVYNENPYGEKIGDSAPFDIDPETIDNAIAEAFNRLKKKSNRI